MSACRPLGATWAAASRTRADNESETTVPTTKRTCLVRWDQVAMIIVPSRSTGTACASLILSNAVAGPQPPQLHTQGTVSRTPHLHAVSRPTPVSHRINAIATTALCALVAPPGTCSSLD